MLSNNEIYKCIKVYNGFYTYREFTNFYIGLNTHVFLDTLENNWEVRGDEENN